MLIPAFERTDVIRGYEVDVSRTTPLPVVFSFLEQLRWAWMSDPAWGLQQGLHEGCFFVVRRQEVELVERPRFGDPVHITGVIESVGRSRIVVRHRLTVDGRPIGHARVVGVWLGPNRRLARLPDVARARGREQARFDEPFGRLPCPAPDLEVREHSFLDAPRQLFTPVGLGMEVDFDMEPEHVRKVVVRPSDCDVFQHVNASTWLHYCNDARKQAGDHGVYNRAVIDYRNEALAGEHLQVGWRTSGTGLDFVIERDGAPLVAARLDRQPLAQRASRQ